MATWAIASVGLTVTHCADECRRLRDRCWRSVGGISAGAVVQVHARGGCCDGAAQLLPFWRGKGRQGVRSMAGSRLNARLCGA